MPAFTPQGYTGGPVNMPGLLNTGLPAALRSEGTEYERATRRLAQSPPASIIGAMLAPQQASIIDAIRASLFRRQQETGYSYKQPPGVGFGSLIPGAGQ